MASTSNPSPVQLRRQIRAELDAAALALEHSRGAFNEGEWPLMRALVDKSLAHLRSANAVLAAHQGPIANTNDNNTQKGK